jgi:hypothetical protein
MPRRALILFLAMLPLVGQQSAPSVPVFRAFRETTKTATAEVITIQIPKASVKRLQFAELFIYCEQDIDVTLEQNGGSATQTAYTSTVINGVGATAVATPYYSSNTTGGTTIDKFSVYGGLGVILNLREINLRAGQTQPQNLTIRTTAFTGAIRVRVEWMEQP